MFSETQLLESNEIQKSFNQWDSKINITTIIPILFLSTTDISMSKTMYSCFLCWAFWVSPKASLKNFCLLLVMASTCWFIFIIFKTQGSHYSNIIFGTVPILLSMSKEIEEHTMDPKSHRPNKRKRERGKKKKLALTISQQLVPGCLVAN